ncbi:fimbrial biogenesis chaperone [Escherichia coli]|uniref:fimbrial biogenesis chaperone n=1 Tax=Escherichia coli TaxID=562 RepID=UPI000A182E6B|nr:molecular chaperone [Escherichia coli]OSL84469.1 chaperone protein EcpD [Escherichia coli T426]
MWRIVLTLLLSACLPLAQASMVIDGTRIIFPGNKKEVVIRATNVGDTPSLTQVWVDDGRVQNQPEKDSAPFIVLPPIVRIEPGKGQSWRLVFNGSHLPQDRESLFWFNLLDIPPEPNNGTVTNYLQLAIRSRIKLFYRPAGIAADQMAPEKALSWTIAPAGKGLRVSNASSRYITIDSITLNGQKQAAGMVAPFSSLEISLKETVLRTLPAKFSFTTINDYGTVMNHNYPPQ